MSLFMRGSGSGVPPDLGSVAGGCLRVWSAGGSAGGIVFSHSIWRAVLLRPALLVCVLQCRGALRRVAGLCATGSHCT